MYAIVAAPIGIPGCPEFAFCTASIDNIRIVLMHNWSIASECLCMGDLLAIDRDIIVSRARPHRDLPTRSPSLFPNGFPPPDT